MAFNPNIDYAAEINKRRRQNPNADVSDLEASRAEKIAAADNEQLIGYGGFVNAPGVGIVEKSTGNIVRQYQQPSQPSVIDNTAQINAMYNQQAAAQAAAIRAARDNTISGYNQDITAAPGQYQPLRNQSSAGGAVRAKGIRETMAASGQGNSGANLTSQSSNNAQTTGEIAGYNLQQTDLVNKLKRAIADTANSASLQEIQSNATINAQRIQAAINEANRVSDTNYARSQDVFGNNLAVAGLTGMYNGTPTMAGAANQAELALKNAQLKELTDPNSITNQMNRLGLDTAKFNYSQLSIEAKQRADQIASELASGRMSRAQAQASIDNLKANAAQTQLETENIKKGLNPDGSYRSDDPRSQDYQYKQAQLEALQGKGTLTYKDYVSAGTEMLNKGNYDSAEQKYIKMYTPDQVLAWVRGLPLTPVEKANLANDLGL